MQLPITTYTIDGNVLAPAPRIFNEPVRRLTGFLEPVCLMRRWDALTVLVMIAKGRKLQSGRTSTEHDLTGLRQGLLIF